MHKVYFVYFLTDIRRNLAVVLYLLSQFIHEVYFVDCLTDIHLNLAVVVLTDSEVLFCRLSD